MKCIGPNEDSKCRRSPTIMVFARKEGSITEFIRTEFMMCLEHGKNGGNTISRDRHVQLQKEADEAELTKEEWNALYDYVTGRALMDVTRAEHLTKKALKYIAAKNMPE